MSNLIPNDWSKAELGDTCFVTKLAGFEYTQHFDYSIGGEIIAVRVLNLKKGRLNLSNIHRIPREVSESLPRSKLAKHDIVISYVGTVGEVALIDEDDKYHLAPNVAKVSPDSSKIIGEYLVQVLTSDNTQKSIQLLGSITSQPSLSMGNLRKVYIPSPPLAEQQKIAKILTSVDEVIEKTQAQIDKLKDLKTGMMQELLTNGIGHTEFKDSPVGRIPAEWEVKELIEVANNLDSKRVPIKSVDRAFMQAQYRYYGASGVIDYVNDYLFDGEYILLGEDGENVLSRNLPLAFIVEGKFWVNNHAHVLTPKANMDTRFLCEYLESMDYKNIASGSAQPKITKGALNAIKVPIPSISEQIKIGKILKSIDDKSSKVISKLDLLKNTKKALMQDLLTGKVRVKV